MSADICARRLHPVAARPRRGIADLHSRVFAAAGAVSSDWRARRDFPSHAARRGVAGLVAFALGRRLAGSCRGVGAAISWRPLRSFFSARAADERRAGGALWTSHRRAAARLAATALTRRRRQNSAALWSGDRARGPGPAQSGRGRAPVFAWVLVIARRSGERRGAPRAVSAGAGAFCGIDGDALNEQLYGHPLHSAMAIRGDLFSLAHIGRRTSATMALLLWRRSSACPSSAWPRRGSATSAPADRVARCSRSPRRSR